MEDPATHPDTHFKTYVKETHVTIGGTAFILESVIGGGEFGRVLGDTYVTIEGNCQIGVGADQVDNEGNPIRYTNEQFINPITTPITNENALAPCSHFPYGRNIGTEQDPNWVYLTYDPYYDKYYDSDTGLYKDDVPAGFALGSTSHASDGKTWIGLVFGGGSGYMPYVKDDGTGYKWERSAGWVGGSTHVTITGGHILTNVYGANEYSDVQGNSIVRMSGGTIGVPRTHAQIEANPLNGNLYGGGKGDPRTDFNTVTNVTNVDIEVTGGIIYGSVYGGGEEGHILVDVELTVGEEMTKTGPVIGCDSTSDHNGNVFGGGKGSPVALTAGVVGGNIELNIAGGAINGSVYGGGEIASVGTNFVFPENPNYGQMQGPGHGNIAVDMTGGTIKQNVYGGCMGTTENIRLGISNNVTVELNKDVDDDEQGCTVKGSIFGCNNVNSSPEGTVTVHVYGTQRAGKSRITNGGGVVDAKVEGTLTDGEYDLSTFDVQAVYGGGNMAAYEPVDENGSTRVIIDGCGRTSIGQVYGGGNAASTPATHVEVNGTYEIGDLFGGGNGQGIGNPGANVGYKDYHSVENDPAFASRDARVNGDAFADYRYGTGVATVNIKGGTIHRVFGGSNTKGNVRKTALTILEEVQYDDSPVCPLHIDEAYGGGRSAPMDAEARLLMDCIPGLKEVYGGAQAADVYDNVTLTITNGTFERVFGGNNISGTIRGSITVNIEETGCKPIIIGELYGGGNLAAYSVYGYDGEGNVLTSGVSPKNDPQINVKSFTSIGNIYGGGYGATAVMVGNPTVNINETEGTPTAYPMDGDDYDATGFKGKTITVAGHEVILPSHVRDEIGAINNVFGGGNEAQVIGSTYVKISTEDEIEMVSLPVNDSEDREPTDDGWVPTYQTKEVKGADIRGNVFGGGNEAAVGANTEVLMGCHTKVEGNVYGGANEGAVGGSVALTVNGGSMQRAFGGSKAANIGGDVTVNVYGGSIVELFGGNYLSGNISGKITVNVDWTDENTCEDDKGLNYVYGGGYQAPYEPTAASALSPYYSPEVNIIQGTVDSVVFGGGYGTGTGSSVDAHVGTAVHNVSPKVVIGAYRTRTMAGSVVDVPNNEVNIGRVNHHRGAKMEGNVFGGGNRGLINGSPKVIVQGSRTTVNNNVYGGGNSAKVSGSPTIEIGNDPRLSAPEFSLDGTSLTLSSHEDADIYYTVTTDGSEPATPTASDNEYTEPITVGEGYRVKAIAVRTGLTDSAVSSYTYTVVEP